MNPKIRSKSLSLLTIGLVIALLAGCGTPAPKPAEVSAGTWEEFEAKLDYLRQEMKIPGMSAAVVKDGQLVWGEDVHIINYASRAFWVGKGNNTI